MDLQTAIDDFTQSKEMLESYVLQIKQLQMELPSIPGPENTKLELGTILDFITNLLDGDLSITRFVEEIQGKEILEEKYWEAVEEIKQLETELGELNKTADFSPSLSHKRDSLVEFSRSGQRFQRRSLHMHEISAKTMEENQKLREAVSSYEHKIESQNKTIEELMTENLHLKTSNTTLENEAYTHHKESADLQKEIKEIKLKFQSANENLEKIKKEGRDFETVFEVLENEKSQLLKEFDTVRFKLDKSERENAAFIKTIQELTKCINELEDQKSEAINRSHRMTQENSKKIFELEDEIQVLYDSQQRQGHKYKRSYSKHESSPEVIGSSLHSFRFEGTPLNDYSSSSEEEEEIGAFDDIGEPKTNYESLDFMANEIDDRNFKPSYTKSPVIQTRTHKLNILALEKLSSRQREAHEEEAGNTESDQKPLLKGPEKRNCACCRIM